MEPFYVQNFEITDNLVDRYGRLMPSRILYFAQEVAGPHCNLLSVDYDTLAQKRMFWAVIRHRVQVSRLPLRGETLRVETWPMPTTRVAYPRSVGAYDAQGKELVRGISLWVLMDLQTRGMVLPGKSGVIVDGTLTGSELDLPRSLIPKDLSHCASRTVTFSCLDRNGHMNNTRYLDWVADLLPSGFHSSHDPREFIVCYHAEALEGDTLSLDWKLTPEGCLQVDAHREKTDVSTGHEHIFSAQVLF